MERRLRRDRDRLPFSPRSRAAVGKLLEFLDSGKIEVRRYGPFCSPEITGCSPDRRTLPSPA